MAAPSCSTIPAFSSHVTVCKKGIINCVSHVLRSSEEKRGLKLLAPSCLERFQYFYTKNFAVEIMDENDKHYSMKSIIFWDMTPCSLLSCIDVSEEHIASIFRVEAIISAGTSKQAGCNSIDYMASYPRR
jgi:hypothetical protein